MRAVATLAAMVGVKIMLVLYEVLREIYSLGIGLIAGQPRQLTVEDDTAQTILESDLPLDPDGKVSNPIVCKSGSLVYWNVVLNPEDGMWMSIVGTAKDRSKSRWIGIGLAVTREGALIKARDMAVWKSGR
jgi:hypothetical protein